MAIVIADQHAVSPLKVYSGRPDFDSLSTV
jgi:hypothetical protein